MSDLLTSVSATDYQAAYQRVVAVLQAQYPTADFSPGSAIDALLLEQQAYLESQWAAQYDTARLQGSISAIVSGQVVATDAQVDALASNYFVTREGATNATGPVRVVVGSPSTFQIPAGFAFQHGTLVFTTPAAVTVWYTNNAGFIQSSTSRQLSLQPDGTYAFTLTVVAAAPGSASRLSAGAALVIPIPLTSMVSATVVADFQGGTTAETSAELLARLQQGITATTLAGPDHIQAGLASQFTGIQSATLGLGSPLVKRSARNLMGIQMGGYQDVFYQVASVPAQQTLQVTGTVTNGASRTVTFTLDRVSAAGVYRVLRVRPATSTAIGGDVPTITRTIQYSTGFQPRYVVADDVAFTAHQGIIATFTDSQTVGTLTTGQTLAYSCDVSYQPSCDAVTSWVQDPGRRPAGQDIRVVAAPPCWVTVELAIRYKTASVAPDATAVAQQVSDFIDSLPFGTSTLTGFALPRVLASLLGLSAEVGSVALRGVINCPIAETDLSLPSATELVLPERPDLGVGAANTYFACSPSSVVVTLVAI